MIPSQPGREDDRSWLGVEQPRANGDQACSDAGQATEARRTTATERHSTASARDLTARKRDASALKRDRAAEARDLEDDRWDAQIASLISSFEVKRRQVIGRSWTRAARDRQRAASDRARSADRRVDAGADRDRAARDRALAAEDRVFAAADRVQAAVERKADEVDVLTGARRRAPGLADIQDEIDRANRGDGRLVAAYVDVDGLKATNDSKGHRAGDLMLKHVVAVLQTQLRAYEPVVRLGGDEFVCTISGTTIANVRERFARISAQLSLTPADGSITVGFAQLARGDSPMDLIDRADRQLIAARDTRDHQLRVAVRKRAGNEHRPGDAGSDEDPQSAIQQRKMRDALDDFLRPN